MAGHPSAPKLRRSEGGPGAPILSNCLKNGRPRILSDARKRPLNPSLRAADHNGRFAQAPAAAEDFHVARLRNRLTHVRGSVAPKLAAQMIRSNKSVHLTPVPGFHVPWFLRDVTISPM
jgi:hypothetical protein